MKISRKDKITLLEQFGKTNQPFIQSFVIAYDRKKFESHSLLSPHDIYKYLSNSMRKPNKGPSNREWWKELNCFGYYYYRYTRKDIIITLVIYSSKLLFADIIAKRISPLIVPKMVTASYPDLEINDVLTDAMNILTDFSGVELFGIKNLEIQK